MVAADQLKVSGALSAAPGAGGKGELNAHDGGPGRVKLLYGSKGTITGTITGDKTGGILPPIVLGSTTHPDPSLTYNDDFPAVALTWNKPFPSVQGYYQTVNDVMNDVPTPAKGAFNLGELASVPRINIGSGDNFFHIVSVDPASTVGKVQSTFRLRINTEPPKVTSSSHPNPTTWSSVRDAFYGWTLPVDEANATGFYYVLDHYGTTVPTATDTFLPIAQKTLIRSGLADGVWGFHVVARDQRGYFTKVSGLYRVRIGSDPGTGGVLGKVVDTTSASVSDANVTVNRGLFNFSGEAPDARTTATGDYGFPSTIPVGTWEIQASKPGWVTKSQTITVTKGATTTVNFTMSK
ncbi:MAG: hypothetical protein NVS3B20_23370 [Polyangiales bacterium]